ncbi:MAG: ABC transporter ATP-binding protein [Tepidisphaeraceae bacterium]
MARRRSKSNTDFWRSCRFLWPYRRTVMTSILCAFLTGIFTAGGLATLLPLLSVLVENQTVPGYVDQKIFETTYGTRVEWDRNTVHVTKAKPEISTRFHVGQTLTPEEFNGVVSSDLASHDVPWYWRSAHSIARVVPTDPVWAVGVVFSFIFVLGIFGSTSRFFQEYLSDSCAIAAINDIRKKLYHHVLHLPVSYFAKNGTGDLTARLVTDAQGLQDGFKTVLGKAIQEPITAVCSLAVALIIDWRLTIFVIVFTPVMVTVIRKLGTKVRRTMRAALEKNSRMLGQIESTLTGIRVVKSAAAEPHERRRYRHIMEGLLSDQRKMARYEAWSTPLLEMLGLAAVGCILMFATILVFRSHTLESKDFIALMMCLVATAEPLRRISKLNNVIQRANAAARRIFEVLETPEEVPSSKVPVASSTSASQLETRNWQLAFTRDIAFDHVTFGYLGASGVAVDDVSLTVPKGTSVAVVGRNGSGKTTLLSLLPRFFEPTGGAIRIDGVDVRDWPIRRLRRMIGIVTQEAIVFPGTIAENIAYGDKRKSREQIVDAAKQAYAHEFITEKLNGYDTPLDGLGSGMSGGQRQRLNIARAILRDTPILILDEATSQVDAESEHLIQQAITRLMKDRTTFVIAHRFSTILRADLIVVMERGKIVGVGKHDELLSSCEIYKQLYERQLFTA